MLIRQEFIVTFLFVQVAWEEDVIWNGEDIKHKVSEVQITGMNRDPYTG
jgi:hypothetical protein